MAKVSAGVLLFRRVGGAETVPGQASAGLEVLIAFPGGPFFAGKGDGAWTLPKGEYGPDEDAMAAAGREFTEEIGTRPPGGEWIDLGSITQRAGKVVCAWAVEGDLDAGAVVSNDFEMEWPPGSGVRRSFPEIARALWCSPAEARRKLISAQVPFVDRLEAALSQVPPVAG
jgi:predicted NUDIX family NTP pyrophosphohydrolase